MNSIVEVERERERPTRATAIMRHGFGGHPYGKDDYIAKERKTSRIHPI